tara:strand:+ start:629 stop:862 length:234 start_codon:yes stop_codon:yes gene_type:complete
MGDVAIGRGEPKCWFKDCDSNLPAKQCFQCLEGNNDTNEEKTIYVCEEHKGHHWNNEHTHRPRPISRGRDPNQKTFD